MKTKRSDLQAIRGIAIIAVLLFHFFPKWFPNGYIGVDQFFVLSGYLIAMILSGSQLDRGSIETFYYRRIKRIVPLYILVVLLILTSMFVFFPATNIDLNMQSAKYALSFATNYQGISAGKQYTVMLHLAVDAFTHTWSLAVEMQFYLLVPLIFFISNTFGSKINFTIGCGSILYNVSVDNDTAFNSVFARLWQFCIGMLSFVVVNTVKETDSEAVGLLEENDTNNGKSRESQSKRYLVVVILYICLGCTLVQELNYIVIPPMLLRVSISLLTGLLIILGSKETISPMNNRILVYMGDISYALYLVHWPLYSYVKLVYPDDFNVLCLALCTSVCLAVFISETYEKCYLKMEKRSVLWLISILYGLCLVVLIFHWRHAQTVEDFKVDSNLYRNITKEDTKQLNEKWSKDDVPVHIDLYPNITKEDAMRLNEKWSKDDIAHLYPPTCLSRDSKANDDIFCEFKRSDNLTSEGPSILIFGNSYAANAADTINENCNRTASRIMLHWAIACETLVSTRMHARCNPTITDGYMDIVRREKPDILILMVRHTELMKPLVANVSIADDPLYKEAVVRLNNYEQLVSKTIYVLNAIPISARSILNRLNAGLNSGNPPKMTELLESSSSERSENARLRLSELVKNCKKCQMIDYEPYLTVDGEFLFYDKSNGLSHFTIAKHLTPYALHKVTPIFNSICRSL